MNKTNKKLRGEIRSMCKTNLGEDCENIILNYLNQLIISERKAKCMDDIKKDVMKLQLYMYRRDGLLLADFYTSRKVVFKKLREIFPVMPKLFHNIRLYLNTSLGCLYLENLDDLNIGLKGRNAEYASEHKSANSILREFGLKRRVLTFNHFNYYL